jgi:DNA-binding NarL/FixJ family response regulator
MAILAAVDDLLFSSKIRATAKQVGVDVQFARSPEEILTQARALKPALAIFDLNSGKTDPIATIAALKADPEIGAIRTIGFASHVHTDLIAAARKAGADEVMPRSAFAGRLAAILVNGERRTTNDE